LSECLPLGRDSAVAALAPKKESRALLLPNSLDPVHVPCGGIADARAYFGVGDPATIWRGSGLGAGVMYRLMAAMRAGRPSGAAGPVHSAGLKYLIKAQLARRLDAGRI
jgi:hypothetical protein